jgi:ABC-type uncharacterized transport system substrate-binding protein
MIIVFTIPATGLSACDPLMLLGAGGPLNTRAAQNAAPTLPIVALSDDMIGEGLTRSLAQPGGNTTGVSIFAPELDGKRQDFLIEAVPGASRMAALADSNVTTIRQLQALQEAVRSRGIELLAVKFPVMVRDFFSKLLISEISSFVKISVTIASLYPEVVSAE